MGILEDPHHFVGLSEFAAHYNEARLYRFLDVVHSRTPMQAPHDKKSAMRDQERRPGTDGERYG